MVDAPLMVHMSKNTGNAPAWLFSFLDLAFLILIALVHIDTGPSSEVASELSSIRLPEIDQTKLANPSESGGRLFQVRVHPRSEHDVTHAFSLIAGRGRTTDPIAEGTRRMNERELQQELSLWTEELDHQPILAPHRDSRSEDFLTALAIVQSLWPEASSAAIRPKAELPQVAAAAPAAPAS